MSVGAIAERYAQALFELAGEADELASLSDQLQAFARLYEGSAVLREVSANPLVSVADQKKALSEVARKAGVSDLGIKFLGVVLLRGRLPHLSDMVAQYVHLVDSEQGILRANVTTAKQMPEEYYQALIQKLEATTHKKVILDRAVDAALIGGAVAQVGDAVLDTSIRGRLEKFEREALAALAAN